MWQSTADLEELLIREVKNTSVCTTSGRTTRTHWKKKMPGGLSRPLKAKKVNII
jgi:hypothetical protein